MPPPPSSSIPAACLPSSLALLGSDFVQQPGVLQSATGLAVGSPTSRTLAAALQQQTRDDALLRIVWKSRPGLSYKTAAASRVAPACRRAAHLQAAPRPPCSSLRVRASVRTKYAVMCALGCGFHLQGMTPVHGWTCCAPSPSVTIPTNRAAGGWLCHPSVYCCHADAISSAVVAGSHGAPA
jgi:hypothetical protein